MSASLNGHRVIAARVQLPAAGVWWAEVTLDDEVELAGRLTLVVADMTLSGTVVSGGVGPAGRARYRVAAGAGRWGATVLPKSYANDAGAKAASVLTDVAAACGETIEAATLPATRVGPGWTRELAPAARVLEQLAPAAWHVGLDGVTRMGRRPVTTLSVPASVTSIDRARGVVHLSPESVVGLVPGVVVEGLEAVDVLHEVTPDGIRSTLWGKGSGTASRELVALGRLLEQLDPDRRFRGTYEYRVVTQAGERLNLQPVRVSIGMPDLQRVPVRPGVSGARANVALGSRVLVTFVDADPARYAVVAFEDAEGDGFIPLKLELDASALLELGAAAAVTKLAGGVLGAARQTDPIVAGPFSGTIVGGSTRVRVG